MRSQADACVLERLLCHDVLTYFSTDSQHGLGMILEKPGSNWALHSASKSASSPP